MQMYDNSPISDKLSDEILCELLQFLQYKVRNKRLSISDAEALRHLFDAIERTLDRLASPDNLIPLKDEAQNSGGAEK